jgi:ATP-dependent helicase YprA (DUF1998 family)
MEIVVETLDCDCEGGCPFCLYQYGCTDYNDPDNFDKERLVELVGEGLRLEPVNGGSE